MPRGGDALRRRPASKKFLRSRKKPELQTTIEERRELIKEGIRILEQRAGREDFNASGSPNIRKLEQETGLQDIQAAERDAAYDEIKQARNEGNED